MTILLKTIFSKLINISKIKSGLRNVGPYLNDWREYQKLEGAEELKKENAYPCLFDKTAVTGIDSHYFYQGVWAFKAINETRVKEHVDAGSLVSFAGLLSTITRVTFIDIRPVEIDLENFVMRTGSITALPFEDGTVKSISCLHVAEHIGLGRYGDPLNPQGTFQAAKELTRVLAPGGFLYFSLPVGTPRVCFNAHRIHSPSQILDYFNELSLLEFSGVNDNGKFIENCNPAELAFSKYACGFFRFEKRNAKEK